MSAPEWKGDGLDGQRGGFGGGLDMDVDVLQRLLLLLVNLTVLSCRLNVSDAFFLKQEGEAG